MLWLVQCLIVKYNPFICLASLATRQLSDSKHIIQRMILHAFQPHLSSIKPAIIVLSTKQRINCFQHNIYILYHISGHHHRYIIHIWLPFGPKKASNRFLSSISMRFFSVSCPSENNMHSIIHHINSYNKEIPRTAVLSTEMQITIMCFSPSRKSEFLEISIIFSHRSRHRFFLIKSIQSCL